MPTEVHGSAATFTKNSAISVGRLLVSTLVALVLPGYLTHKLPVRTYSAWVLILQMSAYVGYLDLGVQTGISKYVAEYEAKGDIDGANMRASTGLVILAFTSILGAVMTLILAWYVPRLFGDMPKYLFRNVRISLILVGLSLSFGLVCSVFSAIFLGLQRYGVPMMLSLINRLLFTAVVVGAVFLRGSLAVMGGLVAMVNIATGILQIIAWRKLANKIKLRVTALDGAVVKQMLSYCAVLAIWSAGMLCVSGLDVTIVGRYDFSQTGFYSIATLPTNFMISMIAAALGPLLPTTSALSSQRSALEMGRLLSRVTRYASLLLALSGLPLLVGGYWILRYWVGADYAVHALGYLRILVLANALRNICLPYATMLVATESQKVAIAGAVAEAIVNLGSSIYLAHRMGAMGVALGTFLGALVSVGMHFAVSMRFTARKFAISRSQLFLKGMLRPAVMAVPSILIIPLWWSSAAPKLTLPMWLGWIVSTLLLGWFAALDPKDRSSLMGLTERRLRVLRKLQ